MDVKTRKDYSTHMPMVIETVQRTKGPVVELGAGIYSTPLLHWLCAEARRPLVTYEKDPEYFKLAKNYISRTHRIFLIDDWSKIDTRTRWSVALIDQDSDRGKTAILLKDSAEYVLLHDSEHEKLYGYDRAYPHFKYIYNWTFAKPNTAVLSNFNNLKWLENK